MNVYMEDSKAVLKKIDHVNVVVSDLEKATDFFCRLGFSIEHRGELTGEWISKIVNLQNVRAAYVQLSLGNSDSRLELIQFFSPSAPHVRGKGAPNQLGIRPAIRGASDRTSRVSLGRSARNRWESRRVPWGERC